MCAPAGLSERLRLACGTAALQEPGDAPRCQLIAGECRPDPWVSCENHAPGGPADDRRRVVLQIGEEVQHALVPQPKIHRESAARIESDTRAPENAGQERHDVALADGKKAAVVIEHPGVGRLREAAPLEVRRCEGRRIAGVGYGALEMSELAQTPLADLVREPRLEVTEVGEGLEGAPFLTHEEHRRRRREQQYRRRGPQGLGTRELREPLAPGAIAHLVVILQEVDERRWRQVRARLTARPAEMAGALALVGEPFRE